jgi:DNA-binding HxlR family transcriptional regulator
MKKTKRRSDCPINFVLETFGDKWTMLIMRDIMFKGKTHYVQFLQSEEKIATNILADRLVMLEDAGILTKKIDPEHGSKYIYSLTRKGIDLMPVLVEMILWSAKYDPDTAAEKSFVNRAKKDRSAIMEEIKDNLLRS